MNAEGVSAFSSIVLLFISRLVKAVSVSSPSYSLRFFLTKADVLIDIQSCVVFVADGVSSFESKNLTTKMADIVLDAGLYVVRKLS
jgi:hypothetical protein